MQSNLPAHLPGKHTIPDPPIIPEVEKLPLPSTALSTHPNVEDNPHGNKKTKETKISSTSQIPSIPYVTADELENTPKYIKGRLTLDKLNAGVEEMQKILQSKYKIMATVPSKMSDKMAKRYAIYKALETSETKGMHFLAESDFSDSSFLKLGDATGKAVLAVLRHLHRIKDLGGTTKRFAIC